MLSELSEFSEFSELGERALKPRFEVPSVKSPSVPFTSWVAHLIMLTHLCGCGGGPLADPKSSAESSAESRVGSPWRDHLPHLSRDTSLWGALSALKATSHPQSSALINERLSDPKSAESSRAPSAQMRATVSRVERTQIERDQAEKRQVKRERSKRGRSERDQAELSSADLKSELARTTQLSDESADLLICLFGLAPSTDPRPQVAARERPPALSMGERARCDALLSRPAESERPTWLSHDWLIIDAHQTIDLGLAMASAQSAHYFKSERARWTLSVTLVRLPSRALDRPTGVPPPLKRWARAHVDRAEVSQWSPTGVIRSPLDLSKIKRLEQLSSPRVGQALTLHLTQPIAQIERGGWALHVPMWLEGASLRHSITVTSPAGARLARFAPQPHSTKRFVHEERSRWVSYLSARGEGDVIYLSSTTSWGELNQWLWDQLHHYTRDYAQLLSQNISAPPFNRFLSPTSPLEIYRWVNERFGYEPHSSRPYRPLAPRELLSRRAGDCKDLSMLTLSLLTQQGTPAYFALTSTRPLPRRALEVPSVGWFDHVFLWLPSPKAEKLAHLSARAQQRVLDSPLIKHRWIDATSSTPTPQRTARFAYVLLSPTQGIWIPMKDASSSYQ